MQGKGFRVFVTGTDTGVGKTEVARALLDLLARAKLRPAPFKPYESGCDNLDEPEDAVALQKAAGSEDPLERICPHRFAERVAPGVASAHMGMTPDFEVTRAAFQSFGDRPIVVEGIGGLFVPLDPRRDVIDLIQELRLPVLLVARAGLGTLNHTALCLEALGKRHIPLLAVVLNKTSPEEDQAEKDNPDFIAHRHGIRVLGPIPYTQDAGKRHSSIKRILKPWLLPELEGDVD
jgi:dethiobiotin synthetase